MRLTASVKSAEGKLVRVSIYYAKGEERKIVDSVMITGDFFMEPAESLFDLMRSLKGIPVDEVPSKVRDFFQSRKPILVGANQEDFISAFRKALNGGEVEVITRTLTGNDGHSQRPKFFAKRVEKSIAMDPLPILALIR